MKNILTNSAMDINVLNTSKAKFLTSDLEKLLNA